MAGILAGCYVTRSMRTLPGVLLSYLCGFAARDAYLAAAASRADLRAIRDLLAADDDPAGPLHTP